MHFSVQATVQGPRRTLAAAAALCTPAPAVENGQLQRPEVSCSHGAGPGLAATPIWSQAINQIGMIRATGGVGLAILRRASVALVEAYLDRLIESAPGPGSAIPAQLRAVRVLDSRRLSGSVGCPVSQARRAA
jgi:hypothetical protein